MAEEWVPLQEFPEYSVSNLGRVRNHDRERLIRPRRNQAGQFYVGLWRGGQQHTRQISHLVLRAFLPIPDNRNFDTPIHLDGDKGNAALDNLMWRPRWFAVMYHMQFHKSEGIRFDVPFREIHTGEVFPNSLVCAQQYGLLEKDIVLATNNKTYVFPTSQIFELVDP